MSEELKQPQDGGEQPSANQDSAESVSNNSTDSESIDPRIKEIIGEENFSTPEETKEKTDESPEAKQPEKKEEKQVPEKKEENPEAKPEGEPKETSEQLEAVEQPKKLDRRIAKLFLSNKLLRGDDDDRSLEDVAQIIQGYPYTEKRNFLRKLLAENNSLRRGVHQQDNSQNKPGNFPWNNQSEEDVVELSEEDHDALVEAEADQRFRDMQDEIEAEDKANDFMENIDSHPELDESKKEYNPRIAAAVEKLVRPEFIKSTGQLIIHGMKLSDAYTLVTESLSAAADKEAKEQKANADLEKQAALSGAVSATTDHVEDKQLTWEKMAEIEKTNPELYKKMVKEGRLPKD